MENSLAIRAMQQLVTKICISHSTDALTFNGHGFRYWQKRKTSNYP